LDSVRARAGRQHVGVPLQLDEGEGDDPRTALDLLPRPDLRMLHQRRPRRCVDRRGRRGQRLLRDRLPAHRHDVAVLAGEVER
jgi:hypothetical protein